MEKKNLSMNCSFRRDSKRVTCQKPTVMGVWIKPRAAWDDRASLEPRC